jgi:hypothetical protein
MALLYYHNRQEVVTLVLLSGPLWPLCDDDKEPPEEIGATILKVLSAPEPHDFCNLRWMQLTF